jgi:hypothetical protein
MEALVKYGKYGKMTKWRPWYFMVSTGKCRNGGLGILSQVQEMTYGGLGIL